MAGVTFFFIVLQYIFFLLKPDALTSLKAFTIISGTAIQEQFERILEGRKECSFLTKLSAKEKQVI